MPDTLKRMDRYQPYTFDPTEPYVTVWDGTVFQVMDADGVYDASATSAAYQAYIASHPLPNIPVPPPPPTPLPTREIHVVEFMQRVPTAKRIAIREAAKSDPILEDFLDIMDKAQQVILDAPNVLSGLSYLVALNLLTQQEARVISPYFGV
jgi:hypothetical protein